MPEQKEPIEDQPADLKKAVFELWYWKYGSHPTNFTARLYGLISHADLHNRLRIASAFPVEAEAYDLWNDALSELEFFHKFGLDVAERLRQERKS